MPERDGYIPGVPCWVDTSQPDPEAAVGFYGGLFGWEFEDVMPPDSEPGTSSPGPRLRRGRRRVDPRGGAADGDVEHLLLGRQRRRDRVHGPRGRRERRDGALRRHGRRPDGGLHRSRGRGVPRLGGEGEQGRANRQRAGLAELQRPQHPRRGRGEVVLRLGVRLADARPGRRGSRCGRCPATATFSSATTPTSASRWRRRARPRGSRTSSRPSIRSRTTSPTRRRIGA